MAHRSRSPYETAVDVIVIVVLVLLALSVRIGGSKTGVAGTGVHAGAPAVAAPAEPQALEVPPPQEGPAPAIKRFELLDEVDRKGESAPCETAS